MVPAGGRQPHLPKSHPHSNHPHEAGQPSTTIRQDLIFSYAGLVLPTHCITVNLHAMFTAAYHMPT